MCPAPIDTVKVKKHAEEDWKNDTKGKDALDFADFAGSMFQLVDMWTETCNSEDYVEALLRLVNGICFNKEGTIRFKSDEQIVYDR